MGRNPQIRSQNVIATKAPGRPAKPNARRAPAIRIVLAPGSRGGVRGLSLEKIAACTPHLVAGAGREGRYSAGVKVCGDREMARLHRRYLDDPTTTDVLAFPAGKGRYLGDVVVCVDVAAREAARRKHGLEVELMFYVLHGLLHLLGLDDATARGRSRMLALQRAALRTCGLELRA